jgi:hypothetical protein
MPTPLVPDWLRVLFAGMSVALLVGAILYWSSCRYPKVRKASYVLLAIGAYVLLFCILAIMRSS